MVALNYKRKEYMDQASRAMSGGAGTAGVVRYTFTVMDLHHLLLAGLPARYVNFLFLRWPLKQDQSAVEAAVEETWSNGPVERQISRLKTIKRQMYGRPGYGVPTPDIFEAVQLLARTEDLLADPVYGGKALAGFLQAFALASTH